MRGDTAVIYVLGFIALATMFMFFLLRKRVIHFKLLKQIFPKKMNKMTLLSSLLFANSKNRIPYEYRVWFYVPIYYDVKILKKTKDIKIRLLQKKLKQNNKAILLTIITIIFWLYGLGYLIKITQ